MSLKSAICFNVIKENFTTAKIGERVKTLLSLKNVQQRDLARHLNTSNASISLKLQGKVQFSSQEIVHIADYLNVSTDVLLGREPLVVS